MTPSLEKLTLPACLSINVNDTIAPLSVIVCAQVCASAVLCEQREGARDARGHGEERRPRLQHHRRRVPLRPAAPPRQPHAVLRPPRRREAPHGLGDGRRGLPREAPGAPQGDGRHVGAPGAQDRDGRLEDLGGPQAGDGGPVAGCRANRPGRETSSSSCPSIPLLLLLPDDAPSCTAPFAFHSLHLPPPSIIFPHPSPPRAPPFPVLSPSSPLLLDPPPSPLLLSIPLWIL